MKTLLAGLMCGLFTTLQCFAIDGGPVYPGGNGVTTTGTYAAVMLPTLGENSIGLFSIDIAQAGLGTGAFVVFNIGQTYVGTIQGTADPDSGKLFALVNGTFAYVQTIQTSTDSNGNPVFTTETVAAVASGQVRGSIRANPNVFSTSAARVTGAADVQFSLHVNQIDSEIIYQIFGFKQTET